MYKDLMYINNNDIFVVKYHTNQNINFNAIISETNSLIYLLKKFPTLFPYTIYLKFNFYLSVCKMNSSNISNR